jgi:hypothetical protein
MYMYLKGQLFSAVPTWVALLLSNVMTCNPSFVGDNDADSKKKSGSMSDDGMSFVFFIFFTPSILNTD